MAADTLQGPGDSGLEEARGAKKVVGGPLALQPTEMGLSWGPGQGPAASLQQLLTTALGPAGHQTSTLGL